MPLLPTGDADWLPVVCPVAANAVLPASTILLTDGTLQQPGHAVVAPSVTVADAHAAII